MSWALSTRSRKPGHQSTLKKHVWHSGAKTSEKNYLSIVPLGEIAQASCRQVWPTPVVPLWEATHGSGPEPSQALRSAAQGGSHYGGRGARAGRLM